MPRFKKKTSLRRSADACLFCNSEEDNVEVYGKTLKKQGMTLHYFCMLFSSGLWQRGKRERDGILGFMPADIFREQKRGNRLTCQYCRKKGATVGCVISNCRKTFHFRCGREAGGMSQFFQQYRSYCSDHRPCQETHTSDRLAFYGTAKSTCSICMLSVEARASNDTLRSPCCRKSWFHRNCIQRYAHSAGAYFFKCPLCNNKELFEAEMLEFGIYIPEQDAAWEKDPSAFQELLERYNCCDTHPCHCPDGREHDGPPGSRWEIQLCDWCGSSGTHKSCHGFTSIGKEDLCKECAEFSVIIAEKKMVTRKCSVSPKAVSNGQEARRRLEHRLNASLRAERAARRQGTSPSPDAPQKMKSAHQGRRARIRGKRVDRAVVSSAGSGESTAVAVATLLRDHRLTRSTPIVYIQRAESESEVGVVDVEETSDASAHQMTPLGCRDSQGSSEPSLVSSPAHLGRNEPGGSLALEQDGPEAEMTQTLSDNTETAQSSSETAQGADDSQEANSACWHDIPAVCREGESPEHRAASSQESLPAEIKQASPQCAWRPQSTCLSPGDLSPEEMPQEMMDITDSQKLSLPVSSQTDHNGAAFAQPVPSYLPHCSSPLCNGSDAVIDELEFSEQNMDTSETSLHTARSEISKKEGQRSGKASGQKRRAGRPVQIRQCPSLLWQNISRANSVNTETVNDENISQRVTRSQSFTSKRLTRSAAAHPQLLKRSYSSPGVPLEQSSTKRYKTAQRQSSTRRGTGENRLIDSCLQQQQNKSFSMGSAGRRERPRRGRFAQLLLDVRKRVRPSDGNNNLSRDNPGLEVTPRHPHSGSPRRPERITQSALVQKPDLHPSPQKTSDCIKKRKHLLSNSDDSLQKLPVPSQDSKDSLTTDKTMVRKKGKQRSDIQPVGLNSSTPDSQRLAQEQWVGDDGASAEGCHAHSLAWAWRPHTAPWLSASTSAALLPWAQPVAAGGFAPQSFLHRMTAFQACCFTPSSLDDPHTLSGSNNPHQDHPGPVLLWNLQFQRRATAAVVFHSQPTVGFGFDSSPSGDGVDVFFPGLRQAVDVPLKPLCSPALPQPSAVDPDPRGVWLVEQQRQLPRSVFARPKLTAPLLSFLGNSTDAWSCPDEVPVTWEELDGLSPSLQLYPVATARTTSRPSAVLCNPFEGMTTSAVAGRLPSALLGRDTGSDARSVVQPGLEAFSADEVS